MKYDMRCDVCERVLEIGCPINQHNDVIKPGIACNEDVLICHGTLRQVILPPRMFINRSPFPGSGNEIQLPTKNGEDVKFRDKNEARDWLGERGLTSKWIENDMQNWSNFDHKCEVKYV